MARKVRLTISSDRDEALRLWRRKQLHDKLAEGYRAMAEEDRETAERHLFAYRETMKCMD